MTLDSARKGSFTDCRAFGARDQNLVATWQAA